MVRATRRLGVAGARARLSFGDSRCTTLTQPPPAVPGPDPGLFPGRPSRNPRALRCWRDSGESCATIESNHLSDRVSVVAAGIGAAAGWARVVPGEVSSVSNRLVEIVNGGEDRVEVLGLADVVALAGGTLDVLKLDVEGAEFAALAVGPSTGPDRAATPGGDDTSAAKADPLAAIDVVVGEWHGAFGDPGRLAERLEDAGFVVRISALAAGDVGRFDAVRARR